MNRRAFLGSLLGAMAIPFVARESVPEPKVSLNAAEFSTVLSARLKAMVREQITDQVRVGGILSR